jgi:DNA-binding MarR family transcriptional regulator
MCVKDIGTRMIEKSSNVPRIIDKLVEKKLTKRSVSGKDKRETNVALTEKGLKLLAQAKERIEKITDDIARLNDDQARELNELLEIMRNPETPGP